MIGEICNTDALTYIASVPNDFFDLIVCDPDYDDWDKLIAKGLIEELMRTLKPSGNLLCFTKQPFDYKLRQHINPWFRREIVWTFTNGGAWCSAKMPLVSFQKIYWCVKSKQFFFNPRTGAAYGEKTRDFKRTTKVFADCEMEGRDFKKSDEGVWIRDHLHFNKPHTGRIPAKPKGLVEILIRCFSPDGGVVYDPFSGTGMVTIVADSMNRECFATEINQERCMNILDSFNGLAVSE